MSVNMMQQILKTLTAGLLASTLIACSTTQMAKPDPDFAPVRPVGSMPLPINDGAIYKSGYNMSLFEDSKAHRVGDIITIILEERTNASKSASTTTAKETEIDLASPTIFGREVTHRGRPILSASVEASRDFTGAVSGFKTFILAWDRYDL